MPLIRSTPAPAKPRPPKVPAELLHLGPYAIPGIGERLVRVCLPPGARTARNRPPLLFMWDGQNVFDDAPSFSGGWHLHRAVERRARGRKTAPVVVGLDHGGVQRIAELSPFPSPMGPALLPTLLEWVCAALIPDMQARFDLSRGPASTVVGGSSMGGLASLYAHLRRPDVFGGAWAMSPSLFLGRGGIFRMIGETPKPWRTRIYIDAGGREAHGALVHSGDRLKVLLQQRGWHTDELLWHVAKHGTHNERHWRARTPRALRFFYG